MPEKEPWRETQTHEPTLRLNRRRWDGLIGCRPLVTGFYWSLIPVNATTESWNEICPNNKKRGLCGETQTWELACWLNPINPESDQRLASGCKGLTDGGKWFLGGSRPPVITGFYRNPRYLCTLQNNWKLKRVTYVPIIKKSGAFDDLLQHVWNVWNTFCYPSFFELQHSMYLVRPVIAIAYNCWSNCRLKLVFLPKRMAGSWLASLTARLLTWSWQQVGRYCLVRRFKCTIENSSWPGCSLCDQRYVYMYHKFPDFSTYRIA